MTLEELVAQAIKDAVKENLEASQEKEEVQEEIYTSIRLEEVPAEQLQSNSKSGC